MYQDEAIALAQKVKNGTATAEEELALFKQVNKGLEEFRGFIKKIMVEDK